MPGADSKSVVAHRVETALGVAVTECVELDGGEVGQAHRCELADGRTVVAKTGATPLSVEARMLEYLDAHGLPVPDIHYASDALLILAYVAGESGGRDLTAATERDVARHLAALHANTAPRYGFSFDSLSGAYRQPNPWTDSWQDFFGEHRLTHVGKAARDEGTLPSKVFSRLQSLCGDLNALVPDDPPASLCHGDVWANNLLYSEGTIQAFLDPACSYSHAEVELAYADLVGFGEAFFDTYEEQRGIDEDFWDRRRDVYALYPILEHVRYFDVDRYRNEAARTLDRLGY